MSKKNQKGFTIIEVLIVLAIAGLIMLIVFLAIPALQRNARNTRRRSDASHMAGLMSEYVANHNGSLPTAGFGTSPNQLDLTNENFSIMTKPSGALQSSSWAAPGTPATDVMYIYSGVSCNNNAPGNGSSRAFAVVFYVEPFNSSSATNSLNCVDS
jgi:prepilin-type N-terminal cleavage/methylation domain-containing protein